MHKITFAPGQALTPQDLRLLAIAAEGLLSKLAFHTTQLTESDLCCIARGLRVFQVVLNEGNSLTGALTHDRPRLDS